MTPLLLPALAWAAQAAMAQQPLVVRRGDLEVRVKVSGTVVAGDLVRLRSPAAARVEKVLATSRSWVKARQALGVLADTEMAAMRDSQGTTPEDTVEDRWKKVYQPTAIESPAEAFLMTVYIKPRQWVKPDAVLFEEAQSLRLVGRVRPQDAQWIQNGQRLEYWAAKDPGKKYTARISRYELDIQGQNVTPGGSFAIDLSPKQYLDPGTEWEGVIVPLTKKDVLTVPTKALIEYEGQAYLPVRVSTGVTTDEFTEISDDSEEGRQFLALDESALKGAQRHHQEPDVEALRRRMSEQAGETAAPESKTEAEPTPEPPRRKSGSESGVDYGEDPYQ